MRLVIEAHDLPGATCGGPRGSYEGIRVGVQRGREAEQLVPADADAARWVLELSRHDDDVRGPHVQGRPGARFVYLVWDAAAHPDGSSGMFRRLKIPLDLTVPALQAALRADGECVVRLGLTGADGTPRCGGLKAHDVSWDVSAGSEKPGT